MSCHAINMNEEETAQPRFAEYPGDEVCYSAWRIKGLSESLSILREQTCELNNNSVKSAAMGALLHALDAEAANLDQIGDGLLSARGNCSEYSQTGASAFTRNGDNQTDPHAAWLIEWRKAREDFDKAGCLPSGGDYQSPQEREAESRSIKLSQKIAMTKARTIEGVAAQMHYFMEDFGEDYSDAGGVEYSAMLSIHEGLRGLVA